MVVLLLLNPINQLKLGIKHLNSNLKNNDLDSSFGYRFLEENYTWEVIY